ncbi:methyltransferase domain-containing protein [Oceanicola sp. S124]|uniref:methyltransferase domain-containing protein n=1 Tax=Oceanicola sp. S124 TaxID=1042378 RepID=UPI0002557DED|nr:methyltransferase domain-containing protein [Oceanicola sp. S124]
MRRRVEGRWRYLGLDYKADANVDLTGDAHHLTRSLGPGTVDLVYSSEVMEHLLSPLRFVFEANRVLVRGGLFIARMPTIWPLHAEPWDFWRITSHGWPSLLNAETGFEILDRCEVGQTTVVPLLARADNGRMSMPGSPAPMLTVVVARKLAEVGRDSSGRPEGLAAGDYDHA